MNRDFLLYAVHIVFWGAFGVTRLIGREKTPPVASTPTEPAAEESAPFSRVLLAAHMVAFGVMYFGIANAVLPNRVPAGFPGHRIVGTIVIALGAALACWSLLFFRSWRFRAALREGHELATGGPFALMRHPIYMALNLLALGTAIWVPTPTVLIALVLMIIGSDARGRAEEQLLLRVFGGAYAEYQSRTRRFIPGIY